MAVFTLTASGSGVAAANLSSNFSFRYNPFTRDKVNAVSSGLFDSSLISATSTASASLTAESHGNIATSRDSLITERSVDLISNSRAADRINFGGNLSAAGDALSYLRESLDFRFNLRSQASGLSNGLLSQDQFPSSGSLRATLSAESGASTTLFNDIYLVLDGAAQSDAYERVVFRSSLLEVVYTESSGVEALNFRANLNERLSASSDASISELSTSLSISLTAESSANISTSLESLLVVERDITISSFSSGREQLRFLGSTSAVGEGTSHLRETIDFRTNLREQLSSEVFGSISETVGTGLSLALSAESNLEISTYVESTIYQLDLFGDSHLAERINFGPSLLVGIQSNSYAREFINFRTNLLERAEGTSSGLFDQEKTTSGGSLSLSLAAVSGAFTSLFRVNELVLFAHGDASLTERLGFRSDLVSAADSITSARESIDFRTALRERASAVSSASISSLTTSLSVSLTAASSGTASSYTEFFVNSVTVNANSAGSILARLDDPLYLIGGSFSHQRETLNFRVNLLERAEGTSSGTFFNPTTPSSISLTLDSASGGFVNTSVDYLITSISASGRSNLAERIDLGPGLFLAADALSSARELINFRVTLLERAEGTSFGSINGLSSTLSMTLSGKSNADISPQVLFSIENITAWGASSAVVRTEAPISVSGVGNATSALREALNFRIGLRVDADAVSNGTIALVKTDPLRFTAAGSSRASELLEFSFDGGGSATGESHAPDTIGLSIPLNNGQLLSGSAKAHAAIRLSSSTFLEPARAESTSNGNVRLATVTSDRLRGSAESSGAEALIFASSLTLSAAAESAASFIQRQSPDLRLAASGESSGDARITIGGGRLVAQVNGVSGGRISLLGSEVGVFIGWGVPM